MFNFKDLIASDIENVFINKEEYADIHNVNGHNVKIIIDSNEQIEREKRLNQNMDGIYVNQKLIYIPLSCGVYKGLPKQGSILMLDGKAYKILDAINEDGLLSITLEANRA